MTIYVLLTVLVLTALYLAFRLMGLEYFRFRGARLVTCPETKQPAAVKVDARHAALTAVVDGPHLRLKECSRWPERRNCGQECLEEIEAAPEDCLVRTIMERWYQGKSCVYCGKSLSPINWLEHKPALLSPQQITVEWREIRPEAIPGVLATHRPACWNCHIAETFRRRYPELVVDRGWGPVAAEQQASEKKEVA